MFRSCMHKIAKIDTKKNLVYGWANIIANPDGSLVVDSQGDMIRPDELENAAVSFMLDYRKSGQMHEGRDAGSVIEAFVAYPEKYEAMGFPAEVAKNQPAGLWIGVKVNDETFAKVAAGDYTMFSIEGTAKRVPA